MLKRTKSLLYLFRNLKTPIPVQTQIRCLHENDEHLKKHAVPGVIKEKYIEYKDEDSVEIFDIEEESLKAINLPDTHSLAPRNEEGLNLKRGITGVYDIADLVDVLERENAINIFVCPVAKELNYVDYMCIVTGRSYRHMSAIAQYVRKIYKKKRGPDDFLPKIEGEDCENWMAMDLGNIALHIFSEKAREKYDLETLWTLGPEFDKETNKPHDYIDLFKQHTRYYDASNSQNNNEEDKRE